MTKIAEQGKTIIYKINLAQFVVEGELFVKFAGVEF